MPSSACFFGFYPYNAFIMDENVKDVSQQRATTNQGLVLFEKKTKNGKHVLYIRKFYWKRFILVKEISSW